jgi:hypothetical protein
LEDLHGQLTQWYLDKEIERLNPGVAFPTFIATVGRGEANEDTLAMTSWMWENARNTWIAEAGGARRIRSPRDRRTSCFARSDRPRDGRSR